jgi:flavin reductase (DIM6/NTAB) family NADH-FMN oxidoreductase RutF
MSVARESFVRAMRGVAHSVAVVTTDGAAGRHGATVSAFCSVSADPPSVLVCLRADSRIAQTVAANGSFCVNVLRDSAGALADRFAGRDPGADADRFAGVDVVTGPGLPAVLAAASAAFCCRVADTLAAGSHLIAVGEVLEVHAGSDRPLAYLDGSYASVSRHLLSNPV